MSSPSLYGAPTVAGEWRGTYRYDEPFSSALPVTFSMRLSVDGDGSGSAGNGGALSGAIRDFGPLGVAAVSRGVQSGYAVVFVKVYEAPPAELASAAIPIQYEGILSDDGRVLRGTWRISHSAPSAPASSSAPTRAAGLFFRRRAVPARPAAPEVATGTWEARRVDPDPLSVPAAGPSV